MANKAIITGGASASMLAVALGIAAPDIKEYEGRRNVPYYDIVNVLTVCDGHTGPGIINKKYSDEECDKMTTKDLTKFATGVLKISPQLAWHPMQLAATISFAYNLGLGTYAKSSVAKLFNEGKFADACNFMPRYKYAGGKVVNGLVARRAGEQHLCLSTLTVEGMKDVS